MAQTHEEDPAAQTLVDGLFAAIERAVAANGGSTAPVKPGHRVKFSWPPHPISYSYHVLASDWTGAAELAAEGEVFAVQVASTSAGVFGRCEALWNESRGDTLPEMLANLRETTEPLFARQRAINEARGEPGRFLGHIRDLAPLDLIKLLYCPDRDVANDARVEIEVHASSKLFTPALIEIVRDQRHPYRRSAQWCVLDLFEDLPAYVRDEAEALRAVDAMKSLIWTATDDYARTVYKAGVVLGGHLPDVFGGPALLECLNSPSQIGRRSAIHGLFHVAEWIPEMAPDVVASLRECASRDPEKALREFALAIAADIESGTTEHCPEPIFSDES